MAVSTVLHTVGLPRRNVFHYEKTASDISPPLHMAIELCVQTRKAGCGLAISGTLDQIFEEVSDMR